MNLKGLIGDVVSNAVKQHFSGGGGDQNRNQPQQQPSGYQPSAGGSGYDPYASRPGQQQNLDNMYNQRPNIGFNSNQNVGYPPYNQGPSQGNHPPDPYYPRQGPPPTDMYNQGYGGGYPGGGSCPPYGQQQPSAYAPYPLENQMPGYPGQQSGYPSHGGTGFPPQGPAYPSQGHPPQSHHGPSPYPQPGGGSYGGGVYPTMAMDRVAQDFHGSRASSGPMMNTNPSLRPSPTFNANADAEALRKAMKGFGTNNAKVIQVICGRTNWERQEINKAFKVMYGKDLIKDLKSELSGDFEDLILALMEPSALYDAKQLHKAMAGLGTKESVLIEIMCSRTNAQIHEIKNAYRQLYGKDLERELIGETSGHFKRLLTSLCAGGRDESYRTDPLKANQDARALYRAGEQRLGTDESTFNAILASQNYAQLRLVFEEYQKVTNHSIEQAINGEFSGDIRDGLLAIVKCIKNRPAYFAELLYASMRGLGTRDNDLIRLVVTRSEIDLRDIRNEYQRIYRTSLEQAIAGDCSGNYKEALIALVKGNY